MKACPPGVTLTCFTRDLEDVEFQLFFENKDSPLEQRRSNAEAWRSPAILFSSGGTYTAKKELDINQFDHKNGCFSVLALLRLLSSCGAESEPLMPETATVGKDWRPPGPCYRRSCLAG
jgi:hypothetical protein